MNTALMFSSASDEWETPQWLFDSLQKEFDLNFDLAASDGNKKIFNCYLKEDDALSRSWIEGKIVIGCGRGWCNPPYSRGLCAKFIAKAAEERLKGFLTVMLLPARTDTKAFHTHIYDASTWQPRKGIEIRFLAGRLKFSNSKTSAPFPSMIVIFRPEAA